MQPNFRLYQITKDSSKLVYSLNLPSEYVVTSELDIIEPISFFDEKNLCSFSGDLRWIFQVGNVKSYEQYSGKNRVTGTSSIFSLDEGVMRLLIDEPYLIWAPVVEFYLENEIYRPKLKEIESIFDINNPYPKEGVPLLESSTRIQNLIGFVL